MHHTLATVFAAAILSAPSAQAATIYKCMEPQGALRYQEKPCAEETKSVSSWNASSEAKMDEDGSPSSSGPLVIGQGNHGHYFVDGAVNDYFLNFVIDTGASIVTLPQSVATSAGLRCITQVTMRTGNGNTRACTTIIQKFRFGSFTLREVEAVIAPNLDQPLLGMNVLKRFRVEQDGGQMRLSKKY
ncbi:MAG TPA: retropepsin-like aspartic protease [Gallionellaceae bacterium]|nr:retropepsin-like aspartic protease [Gallionellaceae bacterium]